MRLALSLASFALLSANLAARADTLYNFNGALASGTTFSGTIGYSPTGGLPIGGSTYTTVALTFNDGSIFNGTVYSTIESGTHEYTYSKTSTPNEFTLITTSYLMGSADDPVCTLTQLCADEYRFPNFATSVLQGQQVETASITAQVSSVTPEPTTIALLGTGLFGLIGVVRKRRACWPEREA